MASAAMGAAIGMTVLILSVAMFAAVFNAYVTSVARGLQEAARSAKYLSSSSIRVFNVTVNSTNLEGYLENTGSTTLLIDQGSVLVVRYTSGNVTRLDVLTYPGGWVVDNVTLAGAAQRVAPGEPLSLEPGAVAHFVANLTAAPDPSTPVIVVYAGPMGVTGSGSGEA